MEYRAWTQEGKLRHLSCKGITGRADNAEVFDLSAATSLG